MDFSLLHPSGTEASYQSLTPQALNDLSIDFICDALTDNKFEKNSIKNTMTSITCDERVITYRRDIFDDLHRNPSLRQDLEQLLTKLADLRELEKFQKDTDASDLWSLINRLREIDGYVECITRMKTSLENIDIKSEGLIKLKELVTSIYNESGFPQLKQDIDDTLTMAGKLRSVTIGVNLDKLLRPVNAGIISLNSHEITDSGLLKGFIKSVSQKDELYSGTDFTSLKSFHPQNPSTTKVGIGRVVQGAQQEVYAIETSEVPTGSDPLSGSMRKTVTAILKKIVRDIKSTLQKYVNISGYSLTSLIPEIIFYIRWSDLIDRLQACGVPMCKAEILPTRRRELHTKGIYNLKLAIKKAAGEMSEEIIGNDFDFSDDARIYVMTGPNRGGKTTFTQAVGLSFLLAQNGIYVPADEFRVSPCDNIFTHFPADENDTVDLGRLGEESQRIAQIFNQATDLSLLLFNESLATTNVSEGLYIAKDVIKAMRFVGTRTIFNTHMHELARNPDEINSMVEGSSRVQSLVTGVENGERSFRVYIAPPQGLSYARDIAVKYGVTFEQIKEDIEKRS